MKDSLSPLLICLVVALVAVWFFLPGHTHSLLSSAPGLRSADAPVNSETAKIEESNPTPRSLKPKATHGKDHAADIPLELGPSSLSSTLPSDLRASTSAAVPAATRDSDKIPGPGEVTIGSESAQVVHALGAPTISAYTADQGHSFETYVYRAERREAIIHLSDGRVSSVILR